jgi:hypothetical protein
VTCWRPTALRSPVQGCRAATRSATARWVCSQGREILFLWQTGTNVHANLRGPWRGPMEIGHSRCSVPIYLDAPAERGTAVPRGDGALAPTAGYALRMGFGDSQHPKRCRAPLATALQRPLRPALRRRVHLGTWLRFAPFHFRAGFPEGPIWIARGGAQFRRHPG